MSYQNDDEMEAEATPLLSSTPTVETPSRRILYLAAAATTCILVVAAVMQSSGTSGISGPINFAQVLFANNLRNTGDNAGNYSCLRISDFLLYLVHFTFADGPLKFLDRHSVDCGDQAINYFHWNAGSRHFDINW